MQFSKSRDKHKGRGVEDPLLNNCLCNFKISARLKTKPCRVSVPQESI